ncbi:MAG: flippase-like domain-containing protein [Chloroflexi bacterium]|nr:flippase-like domain-containing protein [Chloroflexota bacterium]
MRSRLVTLLKIAVTVGGLIFILTQIDLGDAVAQLLRADLRWAAAALLLVMSSLVLRAYRWLLLLRGLGVNLPFARLVRLYFTGHFFNAFLPTGFGGDVVRILEVARHVPGDVAAGTVLLDRLTGLLMLFVLALVALPFRPESFPPQQAAVVLAVALVGLLAGAALLDGRLLRAAGRFLPGPLSPTGEGSVARLLRAVQAVGWPALRGALLVSLVFNLMQVSWWWAAARALGLPAPFGYLLLVVPLLAITLLVPAVGGFGARESVATVLFDGAVFAGGAAPLAAGTGFALSTLVFLLERLSGLPGGPLYLWESVRQR